jgi:hypothetical protein
MPDTLEPCPRCGARSRNGHNVHCANYWRDQADEVGIRFVRLACPTCGLEVELLDQPALPLVTCVRCPARPHLERTAA